VDGGIRRASDVLIALALGARAVGIGRPVLWALALGGGPGVGRYLDLLREELANAMTLAGRGSIADVDASLVAPAPGPT
jgi:4-hydroxymandelate oxidase